MPDQFGGIPVDQFGGVPVSPPQKQDVGKQDQFGGIAVAPAETPTPVASAAPPAPATVKPSTTQDAVKDALQASPMAREALGIDKRTPNKPFLIPPLKRDIFNAPPESKNWTPQQWAKWGMENKGLTELGTEVGTSLAFGGGEGRAAKAAEEAATTVKPKIEPTVTLPGKPAKVEATPDAAPPATVAAPASSEMPKGSVATGATPPDKPPPKEPPESIPPQPGDPPSQDLKGFVRDTEDELHRIQGSGTADKSEFGNLLKKIAKTDPHAADPATRERIYDAGEEHKLDQLSPEDKRVYEQYVKPINKEEDRIYGKLRNAGVVLERDKTDYGFHRMVKGRTPQLDPRDPDTAATQDVITGGSKLPQTASGLRDRVYFSLEDAKGNRKLIATSRNGTVEFAGGKVKPLSDDATESGERLAGLKPGDDLWSDGRHWTVGQATTKEIEANTETRYYKDALVNSIQNLAQLRRVERAVDFLDSFKQDSRFLNHAVRAGGNRPIPPGWKQTQLPQMEGWYMNPKIANALDDFYGQRDQGWEWLTKANRFLVGSMFADPVPHLHNVAAHWFVSRGWENIMPQRWIPSTRNAARAVTQVMTQGKDYQRFLREGGGLLYGDVANRNFYELMLKTMGQQILKDEARWLPLAKAAGFKGTVARGAAKLARPVVNPVADLVAGLYRASRKVLWAGNDMFMMHRYYDLIDRGRPVREAIAEAEKHIPNYRIPSEVLNKRAISTFLKNPNVFVFSRYRYGVLKSFFHMINDLTKGDKSNARLEALGNLAALGVLSYLIYPFANAALQRLTGNKDTKLRPAGPASIVNAGKDITSGEKSFTDALQTVLTPAPASEGLAETLLNRNFFTGQNVLEPDDEKKFTAAIEARDAPGVVKYLRRLSTQALLELSTKLYPGGQAVQVMKGGDDGLRLLAQRLIDIQEKTPKQVEGKEKGAIIQRKNAERRARSIERNIGIPQE
jgi:hypothetical protein